MPWRGVGGVARYGVPGLLLGMALTGGFGSGKGPSAQAQADNLPGAERKRAAQVPAGDPSGTIAFTTTSAGRSEQLLYLIDTKAGAFAIYRVDPANPTGKGAVKLEAARRYEWDLKLTEYNNQPPEVSAVLSQLKSSGQPTR